MAKIIVVDDEQFTVGIVKRILEAGGHTVIGTSSGQECLDKLPAEKPNLVLMDIMMPQMSGWDALKRIREDPQTSGVTVVMLSAKQKEIDKDLISLSNGYITKPFERRQLLAKVDEILAKGK